MRSNWTSFYGGEKGEYNHKQNSKEKATVAFHRYSDDHEEDRQQKYPHPHDAAHFFVKIKAMSSDPPQ